MPAATRAEIEFRDLVPCIPGTRTKVVEAALDQISNGWETGEIHRQHPHLTVERIRAALDYYRAHHQELDRDIEERRSLTETIRAQHDPMGLRQKLEARLHEQEARRRASACTGIIRYRRR